MLALAVFGTWADIYDTSPKFQYYGLTEANRLFRDKHGNINVKKATVVYTAFFAGATALYFFAHWFAGTAIMVVIAVKGLYHGIDNLTVMRRKRKEQTAKLRELRGLLADGVATAWFWSGMTFEIRGGRAAYSLFRWIYIDGVSDATADTARYDIARTLEYLAQQPESEWFEA